MQYETCQKLFFLSKQEKFSLIGFKLTHLRRQIFNTPLILLRNFTYFLHGIVNLHCARCHFVHTIGNDTGEVIELAHFLKKEPL